jgi:XTP/dITP diphosphohydrolase
VTRAAADAGGRLGRSLLLATTNRHKAREVAEILRPYGFAVSLPQSLPAVLEDAPTFLGNAVKKASAAAEACGVPVLADDSGLVVEALGGDPGVRSARYAGEHATDAENNAQLVAALEERGLVDPRAAFVCAAVLVAPGGRVLASAEGRVEGVVRWPARGENGFGYDPLFHYVGPGHEAPGRRFAELSPAEKDAVSHRGRAFRALAERLAHLSA